MRFKKINITERSDRYAEEQKKMLQDITKSINEIGEFFDKIVEFEQYIIKEIKKELIDYFKVRDNRDEIINQYGKEYYIDNIFLSVVDALEEKINITIENWNDENKEYSLDVIKRFIESLKQVYSGLKIVSEENKEIKTFQSMKNLIDSFANFMIYKSIMLEDRVERLNTLTYFKDKLENIEEQKIEEDHQLTIDDL